MSASQLRGALARYRQRARHGRFPHELREQATAYVRERLRVEAEVATIASELGVSRATVEAWAGDAAPPRRAGKSNASSAEVAMVPLMIRPGSQVGDGARLEVALPNGTKLLVTGVAGRELLDAITALGGLR